jgi:hypothetical protein
MREMEDEEPPKHTWGHQDDTAIIAGRKLSADCETA